MSYILDILTKDVKTIKKHIESLPISQYQSYISGLMTSDKKSLQNLALSMSKKLDKYEAEQKRIERLYEYEKNIRYEIMTVDVDKIDELNIFNATYGAMSQIAKNFPIKADHILVDGNQILKDLNIDQTAVIKGDSKVLGIAIASIIAKVTRDRMMIDYDKIYPMYDFASNKGYGTSKHIEAIKKYGTCPIHRMSFLKNIL